MTLSGIDLFGYFVLAIVLGWALNNMFRTRSRIVAEAKNPGSTEPESDNPRIVINVPADYKPLTPLSGDPKVLSNEKALLWYSVYCRCCDEDKFPHAADDADQAVRTVFRE